MITGITVPDTYKYKIGCIPYEFVSTRSSTPETFRRDLTIPAGSFAIVGDTVFIHLDQSQAATISTGLHQQMTIPSPGLRRVQERQPAIIRRAKELRATHGDPIAGLVQTLQDIPVGNDVWDRIAQEPYG